MATAGPCPGCGFTTKPMRTQGVADYAMRRHSCAAQKARQARAQRVADRRASSGVVRDCQHTHTHHEHGTHAAYVLDRCRCRPCRDASAEYEHQRQRRLAYGRHPYVDATPAREHVLALGRQGMGWKRVAAASGLGESVVWALVYGKGGTKRPTRRVRPETEAKILAVTLDLADGALVDGTGTRRRLQALVALGWSQGLLAERLDMLTGNFGVLIHSKRGGGVTHAKELAVRALYDELWDVAPPAETRVDKFRVSSALRVARQYGWARPLAWDDDTIDDPTANPDLSPVERRNHGRVAQHVIEDIEWYLAEVDPRATKRAVADRLGMSTDALERLLAADRGNRVDLRDRLNANTEAANPAPPLPRSAARGGRAA